jgi:GLTT repeat (6 copies)
MSSHRNWAGFAAAAALALAVAAATPANASLTFNGLTSNGLTSNGLTANGLTANALNAQGSTPVDLNGVAVEDVTLPRQQNTTPSLLEALEGVCPLLCGKPPNDYCCGE